MSADTGEPDETDLRPPTEAELAEGGPEYHFRVGNKDLWIRPLSIGHARRMKKLITDLIYAAARDPSIDLRNPVAVLALMATVGIDAFPVLLQGAYGFTEEEADAVDLVTASAIVKRQLQVNQLGEIRKNLAGAHLIWRREMEMQTEGGQVPLISSSPNTDGPENISGSSAAPES